MKPINMDRKLIVDLGDQYNIGNSEPDLFGLEIELEGTKVKTNDPKVLANWITHNDGSLHPQVPGEEGIEYVLSKPLDIQNTRQALTNLFDYLTKTPGVKVNDSYRTSIHVHVNCLQETTRTIVNFLTLCIIFDELLVSQNGETRIGNNFCLRARDAEGQVRDLIHSIENYGSIFNLSVNDRYSAINFVSLLKFGTVEFRSLECTTDLHRVMHWVKTLQALKTAARGYENPKEIIAKFSRRGPLGFMVGNLGDQYAKYALVPGAHHMLQNGMRLAQDFAFCSDWRQATEEEMGPKKSRLRAKPVAMWNEMEVAPGAAAVAGQVGGLNAYMQHFAAAQALQNPAPVPAHWAQLDWPAPMPDPVAPADPVDDEDDDPDWLNDVEDDDDDL